MISKKAKLKFIIIRTIGNFLFLFSLWGIASTFGPAIYLEVLFRINLARNVKYIVSENIPSSVSFGTIISERPTPAPAGTINLFGQLTGGNKVEVIEPVSAQFGIIIPKIGANAPVIPNVDPGNPQSYLPQLQKGVAHAAGTVFPGVVGNIYLFAHSTDSFWNVGRYNAIFYLVKELENGDEIDLFYSGIRHVYRVVEKKIVSPSEVDYLTQQTSFEQLTLQTCWPPGTTFKRLMVIARPEKDILP